MKLLCDGCRQERECQTVVDYGNQCRYCKECAEVYTGFVAAMQAEEQRRQREFDLFQEDKRRDVPLALMPMDLPKRLGQAATPMVLG